MNLARSRKIKVFISSTFMDMHNERDYLNTYIFPRIHEYCKERFIEFYPIDLRWGITEQDSKNGLVMTTCLEAIDDSRPFFIGILGSRYGWMPEDKDVNSLRISVDNRKSWVKSKIEEKASITEIEFEYGALNNEETAHACFFLRDETVEVPGDSNESEDSDDEGIKKLKEEKLRKLKEMVISQDRFPVYKYSSVKEFGDTVYQELMNMIRIEFPESDIDLDNSIVGRHEYALRLRSKSFCDLSSLYVLIDRWFDEGSHTLAINGTAGYGTSTSLASAVCYIREKYNTDVHYYDFEEADLYGDKISGLLHFMSLVKRSRDCEIIALDNCAVLTQTECNNLLKWLLDYHQNTGVIFSTSQGTPADIIFGYCLSPYQVSVNGYFEQQRRDYIKNFLRNYGKKLTDAQIDVIYNIPAAKDPTYLSFILNDLLNFGLYEKLDEHLQKLVDQSESDDMFAIFKGIREQSAMVQSVNCSNAYAKAMVLLAQLKDVGISEYDLCSIAGIPSAQWSVVRPFVLKWCKGNKSKLVFIKYQWSHGIKQIWSTPWQAAIGVGAIDWFLSNRDLAVAVDSIVPIWMYIWHLPIDEGIGGKDKYDSFKRKLHDVSCSPDVVLKLDMQRLTWLFRHLTGDFPIENPKIFYGRNLLQLSYRETEDYYLRMAQVATNLNCYVDASYCYDQLSNYALKNGNDSISVCYKAMSLLSIGRAQEAIKLVAQLLPAHKNIFSIFKRSHNHSIEDIEVEVMALCISCKASVLSADTTESMKKLMRLNGYVENNEGYFNGDDKISRLIYDVSIEVLYLMCYTRNYSQAINLYNSLCKYKETLWFMISPDGCAKFMLSASLIWLHLSKNKNEGDRCSENEACYKYASDALQIAWLSGQNYLQNQAKIIADYIYYKVRGEFRDRSFQIYKNTYNPPAPYSRNVKMYSNRYGDWSRADEAVKAGVVIESNFYDCLISDFNNMLRR